MLERCTPSLPLAGLGYSDRTHMSTKQNTEWLDAAHDNFTEAVAEENIKLAKAIIADVLEAGFRDEAQTMVEALREIPIGRVPEDEEEIGFTE